MKRVARRSDELMKKRSSRLKEEWEAGGDRTEEEEEYVG
jgi:hypothetical protein